MHTKGAGLRIVLQYAAVVGGVGADDMISVVVISRIIWKDVYGAYCQTAGGRYLIVFYIRKLTGEILPISARDMDDAERNYYGKQK